MNPFISVMVDAFANYCMQGLPTIGGQISRILDKNKREYYYLDKTSDIPTLLQRFIGKASSKIPFASYLFAPSVDEWGRDEEYGEIIERLGENTVSPGYYSKKNYTKVDNELKDLYEKTGNADTLPVTQAKYFEEDSVRYNLTAEEYTEAKKNRGQKSFEYIQTLISNKQTYKVKNDETGKFENLYYNEMTDKQKVRVISNLYQDAGDYAKAKYMLPIYEQKIKQGNISDKAKAILEKKIDDAKKTIEKTKTK
jgi:hypothetical protein